MAAVGRVRLVVAAVAVLGLSGVASAQSPIPELKVEGEAELGGRVFVERPSKEKRAKLEEYRDLSEQPFGAFLLRLFKSDESYSVELGGSKIGQEDQEYSLEAGRTGLWRFGFNWNQTPHILSTNARLLATEDPRGVFTLPTPRPPLATYNTAEVRDEISTRWDTAQLSFALTPTPNLDLTAQYMRIRKNGERPSGVTFGAPGNNFLEVLQPLDQTIHDLRLRGAFARDWWQLQLGYLLSIFRNDNQALVADNPCFGLAACGDDAAGAPERGRVSLAPNNIAHTFTLAGGANLPMRTRVNANVSYSLRLQDKAFLPHTINPALAGDPSLVLPQNSLDGVVHTLLFNLNGTSRPLPPLTLSLRYRLFDFDDGSKEISFPGRVQGDRELDTPRTAIRYSYTKHNLDLDGRWRFRQPVAVTLGGGWERWDRSDTREVPHSNEYFGKLALDLTPFDWFLGRVTYIPSFRRISGYDTAAFQRGTVPPADFPDEAAAGQSPLLRKYDEGERNRHRVNLMLQFTPADAVTAAPTASYRHDDYINSPLGLQKAESWSAGIDVDWHPWGWLSVSAGYLYESTDQRQRGRDRERDDGPPLVVFDFADFDLVTRHRDTVHTVQAAVRAAVIPKVLDWTLGASYSRAKGEVNNQNPLTPTSGSAADNARATAQAFPDFKDSLVRLETAFAYHFLRAWTLRLGYIFERFQQKDFRTDSLNPFMPGTTSIWLGNDLKDYTAHIVAMKLSYTFR